MRIGITSDQARTAAVVGSAAALGIAIVTGVPQGGLPATANVGSQATGVASARPAELSPEWMSQAAEEAADIEKDRRKRAAERAQRSSGRMFTPTKNYKVSATFGQAGGWSSGHHTGLDFAAPEGTPVFAALAGEVVAVGYDGAYGNRIIVKHDGIKTMYAHLSATDVKKGDRVLRGEVIGRVGSTGRSTGAHLHFEVLQSGDQKNPAKFL